MKIPSVISLFFLLGYGAAGWIASIQAHNGSQIFLWVGLAILSISSATIGTYIIMRD